jgi:hypothetical protein
VCSGGGSTFSGFAEGALVTLFLKNKGCLWLASSSHCNVFRLLDCPTSTNTSSTFYILSSVRVKVQSP